MTTLFTILFDGVAYGMLLFVLACGLAVTLGLMNFVNLAHGAFAMTGGYVCAVLVNQSGWPFFAAVFFAYCRTNKALRTTKVQSPISGKTGTIVVIMVFILQQTHLAHDLLRLWHERIWPTLALLRCLSCVHALQ